MRRIAIPALAAAALAFGALGAYAQSGAGGQGVPQAGAQSGAQSVGQTGAQSGGPAGWSGMRSGGGPRMAGMPCAGPRGRHMGPHMGPHGGPHAGRHGGPGRPAMMKMMFAVADADGDGEVSLAEMQEIQARIFRAMDADDSGGLTRDEIAAFIRPDGSIGIDPKPGSADATPPASE